jgi:hypothetical protein
MSLPTSVNLTSEDDDDWQGLTAGITSALMLTSTSASSSRQSTDNTPSFADEESPLGWWNQVSPSEFLKYVDLLNKCVMKFKEAWSKPFREIESSYKLLVMGLKEVNKNMILLHSQLSHPVKIKGQSSWKIITHFHAPSLSLIN